MSIHSRARRVLRHLRKQQKQHRPRGPLSRERRNLAVYLIERDLKEQRQRRREHKRRKVEAE